MSIQAIKIRANKNSEPKDKIKVEWLDISTKRHFMAKKNRSKGNNYELQVIKELTELGFSGLKSSRSESKNLDNSKIDIVDTENVLDCHIQCKATKNTPNIESITKECPLKDKPLIIFWKKQNDGTTNSEFVLLPKEYYYKLINK